MMVQVLVSISVIVTAFLSFTHPLPKRETMLQVLSYYSVASTLEQQASVISVFYQFTQLSFTFTKNIRSGLLSPFLMHKMDAKPYKQNTCSSQLYNKKMPLMEAKQGNGESGERKKKDQKLTLRYCLGQPSLDVRGSIFTQRIISQTVQFFFG